MTHHQKDQRSADTAHLDGGFPRLGRDQSQRIESLIAKLSKAADTSGTDVYQGPNGPIVNTVELDLNHGKLSRTRTLIVPVEGGIEKGFFRFRTEGGKLIEAVKCGPYGDTVAERLSANQALSLFSRAVSLCTGQNRISTPAAVPYREGKSPYGPSFDLSQGEGGRTKRPKA